MSASRILAGTVLLAMAGCTTASETSPPPVTPAGQTRIPLADMGHGASVDLVRDDQISTGWIDADVADAWRNLLAVYAALGFEVKDLAEYVPEARRVTVSQPRIRRLADKRPSTYLECGHSLTSPKADKGGLRVFLSTWLEPLEGGTRVTTRFEASARDTGTSTAAVACASNGRLEQLIADQLLLRIIREKQAG